MSDDSNNVVDTVVDVVSSVAESDGSGTETVVRSAGSRISDSLAGMIIGPLIFLASFVLLFWNEGNEIQTIQALAESRGVTISAPASPVEPGREGRLLHVIGELRAIDTVADRTFGVSVAGALRLRRSVEMFQWSESKNDKTIEYTKKWSSTPIDSSSFESQNGRVNPGMPFRDQSFNSANVMLGDFRLDQAVVSDLDFFEALPLDDQPAPKAPFRKVGKYLFRGANPSQPQVGDIRVSFEIVKAQPVTLVAQQMTGVLVPYWTSNGSSVHLVQPGYMSVDAIYGQAQNDAHVLAWVLRVVGFVLMLIGPMMFLKPLSTFLSFIPFLGDIAGGLVEAGAFLVSLLIALPLTLITIAIAWLFFRPLIGGALLVVALGALFGLSRWRRARVARSAP